MSLSKTEQQVIENLIKKLKCQPHPSGQPREADHVREALRGPAALYLDTWVIPALELLLPGDKRSPELALRLSR